jgi:hypothetical protein
MSINSIRLDSEDARWIDTQQALSSVESGKTIHEEAVKSWLETWGKVDEKDFPGAGSFQSTRAGGDSGSVY